MSGATLWTILVPTIGQREALFLRLMGVLLPQLDEFGGAVKLLAWRNNGQPPIGDIRDAMVRAAHDGGSEYIAFVDDDDLVPEYYASEVVRALGGRPDHVGFKIEYHENGEFKEVVDHSLKHGKWCRNAEGVLVRDFTHIDPVRAELARQGSFFTPRAGRAEDRTWVKSVRGRLRTEAYIDKIMYRYLFRDDTTAWARPQDIVPVMGRPAIDHPHFAWHERSDP